MKQRKCMSIPERVGRWAGRAWSGCLRRERGVLQWLRSKGVPVLLARTLLWAFKLVALGMFLYAAFWLALVVISVVVVLRVASLSGEDDKEEWAIGEQRDHKDSMFYDPVAHNDTTDPRYEDD
ncbi:uncharacterized protein DUF3742 [Pseudomonas sp. URIL14HWK12:I3]|uniref:DUF3742 family protein n=1 Tax=unclassified Pseudomonas TaxID=196821 RepID=UPI000DADF0BA|nr:MULTISPECIES: DUF3742 family protein [unclassified Pseudomonas]PZW50688.1 uncharacterized protein DUF3742 [Pseudomonas sp. URIL14HWK12:I2]PZW58460.1 uncharacterized protein DUF3742 [Pseudomonas sp. URIL14HWK12:I3]